MTNANQLQSKKFIFDCGKLKPQRKGSKQGAVLGIEPMIARFGKQLLHHCAIAYSKIIVLPKIYCKKKLPHIRQNYSQLQNNVHVRDV